MLTLPLLRKMLNRAGTELKANSKYLCELDSVAGDGDHGITIGRMADVMKEKTEDTTIDTMRVLLDELGDAFMGINGGSAGPLWGTVFTGMAEGIDDQAPPEPSPYPTPQRGRTFSYPSPGKYPWQPLHTAAPPPEAAYYSPDILPRHCATAHPEYPADRPESVHSQTSRSAHAAGCAAHIQLIDEQGAERTLLLSKSAKFQIGARYRFYFQSSNHPTVGNDYLDAALSTNSFLGYEALGEPAVQEEQAKENG